MKTIKLEEFMLYTIMGALVDQHKHTTQILPELLAREVTRDKITDLELTMEMLRGQM